MSIRGGGEGGVVRFAMRDCVYVLFLLVVYLGASNDRVEYPWRICMFLMMDGWSPFGVFSLLGVGQTDLDTLLLLG
jgi:hypothetical protein